MIELTPNDLTAFAVQVSLSTLSFVFIGLIVYDLLKFFVLRRLKDFKDFLNLK